MRGARGVFLLALFLTGGTGSSIACSPCRVQGQDDIDFLGGNTNASRTMYETGGPGDEMLYFPQGRVYDLFHGLGSTPASIDLFVSFRRELEASEENTDDKTEPNNVAPTAGNQAVVELWNDEFIRVRNDTCAEFYLRAVIWADPDAADALGGAGGMTEP